MLRNHVGNQGRARVQRRWAPQGSWREGGCSFPMPSACEKMAAHHNLSPEKETKAQESMQLHETNQTSPLLRYLKTEKGTKKQRQEGERHNGLFLKAAIKHLCQHRRSEKE